MILSVHWKNKKMVRMYINNIIKINGEYIFYGIKYLLYVFDLL